jgi:DNA helicase-2/ATP-dependent DNA helicase PcrA
MQTFAAALAAQGIPHRILGLGGLLATPEVVDVVSTLRVLHDPTAGSALIRLLVGPRFSVGVADMAALQGLAAELSRRDSGLLPLDDELRKRIRASRGADEALSIIDAVDVLRGLSDDYRLLSGITPEGRSRIRAAGEMLERLRRASSLPLPDMLRLIELELRLDIELAANETRGPARIAATQLRAFTDEVRSFLAADERGTISSLLAWLEKAESTDELVPRPEPPEPGVVQLLTVHGSKGLEWDAVAVVRMVEGELPSRPTDTSGWFGFGVLPFALRGDSAALPTFSWIAPSDEELDPAKRLKAGIASLTSKSKTAPGAITVFKDSYREYQQEEERRLAYVAVTRARSHLLLTGAHWAGQKQPKAPSPYLIEAMEVLGRRPIEPVDPDENPYEGPGATLTWPLDPLGARRGSVESAAAAVRAAAEGEPVASPELVRLLAERAARLHGVDAPPPTRVPASRFKDYVTDFAGTVSSLVRPMPERPYRQTRLGTLVHAWVERRSELVGVGQRVDEALWEVDEDDLSFGESAGGAEVSSADAADLSTLQEIFEASEWGSLKPIAVEIEIDFALGGGALPGDEGHIVICKLDAVYRREDRGGRIEIVDWKTGKAPRTPQEREERMLQLALYRLAYHRRFGVPLDEIDVALYYVADDLVIRGDRVYSESELFQRWSAARAAR